jgi:hypothetical protein
MTLPSPSLRQRGVEVVPQFAQTQRDEDGLEGLFGLVSRGCSRSTGEERGFECTDEERWAEWGGCAGASARWPLSETGETEGL